MHTQSSQASNRLVYDIYDSIFYALYFFARLLVIVTSYILCIIASLYATGSLITLEVTSFFCPLYNESEIRQYNLENGNQEGDPGLTCRYIDRTSLNYEAIFSLDSNIFEASVDSNNITFGKIFQTIAYSIAVIILIIPTLYHTYLWFYDTLYALLSLIKGIELNPRIISQMETLAIATAKRKSKNTNKNSEDEFAIIKKKKKNKNKKHNKYSCLTAPCFWCCGMYKQCCRSYMKFYFSRIMPVYYVDSKCRMLSLIFREWIEISVQFYALLLYGGINIFLPNSNVKSQNPNVIEAFAMIIGLNCICGMFVKTSAQSISCFVFLLNCPKF